VVRELQDRVKPRHWQVALKRRMYRTADRVAAETGADVLVTGDSLGQVSSQTLGNLPAIDAAAERPLLRPLCGLDKAEIIAEAKRIGTAPLSERVQETCTLAGHKPAVTSSPGKLDRIEADLDDRQLDRLVAERRVLDVTSLGPEDLRRPYLFTDRIPDDARVIDCQPAHMYRAWHVPGAEHWEVRALAENFRRLPRGETYVLYCTFGTQTPALAEVMQQAGYDAYAFADGLSRVQQAVDGRAAADVRAPQDAAE
jgi:thiamine biosynthesis protein ThiI